jgi:hypothetical protein
MKLFIDMDGVLCDFNLGVKNLGEEFVAGLEDDAPIEAKQKMWDAIEKAGDSFWADLEWTADGKDLWEVVKKFNPIILSSPGEFRYAPSGKALWVKKNIPGTSLFLSDSKSEYIDPYQLSVLIDDSENNVGGWKERGGEGILHTTAGNTEKKFLELLWATPEIDLSQYLS